MKFRPFTTALLIGGGIVLAGGSASAVAMTSAPPSPSPSATTTPPSPSLSPSAAPLAGRSPETTPTEVETRCHPPDDLRRSPIGTTGVGDDDKGRWKDYWSAHRSWEGGHWPRSYWDDSTTDGENGHRDRIPGWGDCNCPDDEADSDEGRTDDNEGMTDDKGMTSKDK